VLLVIEQVIAGPNEGAPAKFGDLNMMVAAGGQERTREEWVGAVRQDWLAARRSTARRPIFDPRHPTRLTASTGMVQK